MFRLYTTPENSAPPALRTLDDLLASARRYQQIAHVDWAATGHGTRERAEAREEYIRALSYADGIEHARQVMGERS